MPFFHKVNCSSSLTKGEILSNGIFSYCYNSKFRTKSETESKAIFLGRLHQVKIACHGKEYYKLIGILNDCLNHEGIKSKTFCDEIRRIIIQEAEPVRLEDEKYYSSNILLGNKKEKATCTGSNPFEGVISLNIKRKDIKQKHLDEIDRIVKNWMSDDRWRSILLEAQVLALSCRSKVVYVLMIMQNSTKLGRKDRVKMIHLIALLHSLFLQGIIWNALYGNHHQSPTSFS